MINNTMLPSSEPDRKSFSFDLFPSSLLDNLFILKTASPDLPGEFAGKEREPSSMPIQSDFPVEPL